MQPSRSGRPSRILIHAFFVLLCAGIAIPFLTIISISLSNDIDLAKHGYSMLPRRVDLTAYRYILRNPDTILTSYFVTVLMSFAGVAIYLLMASMCAYALSHPGFRYRNGVTFYLFFTMLFSGGLVPYYILMTQYLRLRNTFAALVIPLLGNVWYLFLMRTFFRQLPASIIESATIDGARESRIFVQIVLPLSTPVIATVGLLKLLENWNSWYYALLFIDNDKLYPLQYLLQVMMRNIQEILRNMQDYAFLDLESTWNLPTESTRMAMCLLAAGPMLFVFPFFQKYFTKGLTVGSLKE